MSLAISVVVPTYNRIESLRLTLAGLAKQTIDPELFEVVVVSDGSTDGTDLWLKGVVSEYAYALRPIFQQNSGPSAARNRGIAESRGDIVVFLDDDVEPGPGCLEVHLRHHRKDPAIGVVGPQSPDPARRNSEPPWIVWEHEQLVAQYRNFTQGVWKSAGPNHFYTGNASVRAEHLRTVGGFDTQFGRQEDTEMAMRLERDHGIRYVFDIAAQAVHRPTRTFESWCRTPYSYGALDARRCLDGNLGWHSLRHSHVARNAATQRAVDFLLPRPRLWQFVQKVGRLTVRSLWKTPGIPKSITFRLLSAIYNVRYAEGVRDTLGSDQNYRMLVNCEVSQLGNFGEVLRDKG